MALLLVSLLLAAGACVPVTARPRAARVFLGKELPLTVVLATPGELAVASSEPAYVLGRQAIQVVFSRPVIALGSDFGDGAAAQKVPFRLTCPVPGKFRWVTTTTARFDPDIDWPADLRCQIRWSTALKTYDGAKLQLGAVPARRDLASNTMYMASTGVLSELANNVTGYQWNAYSGSPGDKLPEVPPDGRVSLSFSYPVTLAMIKSAFQLLERSEEGEALEGPTLSYTVRPCWSSAPWVTPQPTDDALLNVNSTCAEVEVGPQLKLAAWYILRLPKGVKYNPLSGPTSYSQQVSFAGLRRFRIPFRDNTYAAQNVENGYPGYRRLDLWLPHGLAPATPPAALASRLSICEVGADNVTCTPLAFTLTLPNKSTARLAVPGLSPGKKYRVSAAADPTVKDGFGMGLEASTTIEFYMAHVMYRYEGPLGSSRLGMIEAGADSLSSWPYITIAPPPYQPAGLSYDRNITSYSIDLNNAGDVVKLLRTFRYLQGGVGESTPVRHLGAPSTTVVVPAPLTTPGSGAAWAEVALPLGSAAAQVAYACCTPSSFVGGTPNGILHVLIRSSLSVSVVTAGNRYMTWVNDAAEGGGLGAVAGAAVSFYAFPSYVWQEDSTDPDHTKSLPFLVASCTTDASGACAVDLVPGTTPGLKDSMALSTVVTASGGRVALLPSGIYVRTIQKPSRTLGTLILDRKLVVPGSDGLKVTGYIQRESLTGLQLPPASYGVLEVSPDWGNSATGGIDGHRRRLQNHRHRDLIGAQSTAGSLQEDSQNVDDQRKRSLQVVAVPPATPPPPEEYDSVPPHENSYSPPEDYESDSKPRPMFLVKVDGNTGSVHGEIPVPEDAKLLTYLVTLWLPPAGEGGLNGPEPIITSPGVILGWTQVASVDFTVADPRPPTAELQLEVSPWVLSTDVVTINATAVSYIGASVDGAAMTLVWSHEKASGAITLTTDASGFASATIDLGALPEAKRTAPGDTLRVAVEWIGPTRERITQAATVTIAAGPYTMALGLSLTPSLPGTPFGLSASLTSNADSSDLPGIPISAILTPVPAGEAGGASCSTVVTCTTTTGYGFTDPSPCRLALPCVGRFELEACAELPVSAGGGRVCSKSVLGRNTTEWLAGKLSYRDLPLPSLDKTGYALGDTPKLSFESPFPNARVIVVWGNDFASKSKVVSALPSGSMAEVEFGPLGDECRGGCAVTAVLDVPRRSATAFPLPPSDALPVSRLFDPRAPFTHVMRAAVTLRPDNSLDVSVAVAPLGGAAPITMTKDTDGDEVLAIEPGAKAEVTVSVGGTTPAAGVEVTVYGVDKAFLDMMPYGLPKPEQELVLRLAAGMDTHDLSSYRLAPGAVRAVFDKMLARLTQLDPWLYPDTYHRTDYSKAVDLSDDEYLASYTTALTYTSGMWSGDFNRPLMPARRSPPWRASSRAPPPLDGPDAAPTPPVQGDSGGGNGPDVAGDVRSSADFLVTPLFSTATTGPDGLARVVFTAPANLGTFVLRAFAAAGSAAKYGSGEGKVVVRRRLSLTPSVPRFVRVGDAFEAGVIVTMSSAPASITVTVQVEGGARSPLFVSGSATKTLTFAAGDGLQEEIRFSFNASAMGTANFTMIASDGQPGGSRDAVEMEVPVIGQQGDVLVATSFALAGNVSADPNTVQWVEGMELPAAVPGSGGLTLTAGVGYFPALASMYGNLMTEGRPELPYAEPAMTWAVLPAVLSYYGQNSTAAQDAAIADGLSDLKRLTSASLGLVRADIRRWNDWQPTRVDLRLNTWALFLAALHGPALMSPQPGSPLPAGLAPHAAAWAQLEAGAVLEWQSAVGRQLVADAEEARGNNDTYADWDTLTWARLVLGATWAPAATTKRVVDDLSLKSILDANRPHNNSSPRLERSTRVVLSLLLLGMGSANPDPAVVNSTVQEISSALRVQGRTAYVAAGPGSPSPASVDDQALALMLLLRTGATHQLMPKLAAYVANPVPVSGRRVVYYPASWSSQALAAVSLSEYDRTRGSSRPNLNVEADANGLTVLKATFRAGRTRPVSNTTNWRDVPAPEAGLASELNFQVSGRGEVSVAAALQFVPANMLAFPTYRGLYVETVIQMVDPLSGSPTGRALSGVPLASIVAYTVQLTSPDDLGAVTLSVMMPGGLEPLDPNVAAGSSSGCGMEDWGPPSRLFGSWWWWWPMCPSQETKPSLVTFSYAALRAGTSSITIKAVAATAGAFALPPVRAWVDNQPELMGMTAGGSFTVCAGCQEPVYAVAPPVPKACMSDCSGNGLCNLYTGVCSCDEGYTGSACAQALA